MNIERLTFIDELRIEVLCRNRVSAERLEAEAQEKGKSFEGLIFPTRWHETANNAIRLSDGLYLIERI